MIIGFCGVSWLIPYDYRVNRLISPSLFTSLYRLFPYGSVSFLPFRFWLHLVASPHKYRVNPSGWLPLEALFPMIIGLTVLVPYVLWLPPDYRVSHSWWLHLVALFPMNWGKLHLFFVYLDQAILVG